MAVFRLKEFPDDNWMKMNYNQDAWQWVERCTKPIIIYVNEAGEEIGKFTSKNLIKNGNWMVREVIKKKYGSPSLIPRKDGKVVKFPQQQSAEKRPFSSLV